MRNTRWLAVLPPAFALVLPMFAHAQSEDPVQVLPPVEVTPDDSLDNSAMHGRLMKKLPCIGCDGQADPVQPPAFVRAVLWMLYPSTPPEYTEAELVTREVVHQNHHADQLP